MTDPKDEHGADDGPRADEPRDKWLAQADESVLDALSKSLADEPGSRPARRIARDILLLEMTESRAEKLKSQYGPSLLIERDEPLKLFE